MERLYFILYVCFSCVTVVFAVGRNYGLDNNFDNLMPPPNTNVLASSTAKSKTKCAMDCASYQGLCHSFFFTSTTMECELHDTVWESNDTFTSKPDSKYYKTLDPIIYPFQVPPVNTTAYTKITLADNTTWNFRFVYNLDFKFNDAFGFCASEGAQLAKVTTVAKRDVIHQIRLSHGYSPIWIDGNNNNAPDYFNVTQWVTSTNDPIPTDFWYPGQPNSPNNNHCLYLYALGAGPSVFADAMCNSNSLPVLCEKV